VNASTADDSTNAEAIIILFINRVILGDVRRRSQWYIGCWCREGRGQRLGIFPSCVNLVWLLVGGRSWILIVSRPVSYFSV
jgi:hypothetical protein